MGRELRYHKPGEFVTVDSPSWEDIESRLKMLGQGIYVCHLTTTCGTLSIGDTKNPERVTVSYSNVTGEHGRQRSLPDDYKSGRLLDTKYANSKATVEVDIEGMLETELLYQTVAKELAIEVAEHFWETDTFPEGLDWDGTMGRSKTVQ